MVNSSPTPPAYQQQRSLPYPTLPTSTSARNTGGYYTKITNLSAISEPNIVELNLIDHIPKFSELPSKLNDNEILPHLHHFDNAKYIPLTDANPMTQTILERVHGSGSMMTLRHNSILNTNNMRRSSSDNNNNNSNLNGTINLDTSLSRQRRKSNGEEEEDDDDNESTSSESSSTKSSHTIAVSSSSSTTNKSTMAALRAASSLFHGGKRQLTRLVNRSFLRKTGKKTIGAHHVVDMDEEEEDGERLLINDGSNGDLKYKASRNLKEQPQFDKTQLLQTIVNAHNGPIWCMR